MPASIISKFSWVVPWLFRATIALCTVVIFVYVAIVWAKMPRIADARRASFTQPLVKDIPLYSKSAKEPIRAIRSIQTFQQR